MSLPVKETNKIKRLARMIMQNQHLLITAGAGMGVDSGLPDFRGKEGLWKAYPMFKELNMSFQDAANHHYFKQNPQQFWFFYGHRYNLYKNTRPHRGYKMLLEIAETLFPDDHFVFTSNVDGHFQKSGFDPQKIYEVHGNINHLQCGNCETIYEKSDTQFILNLDHHICENMPLCPDCQHVVRPNILFFGDYHFNFSRVDAQGQRFFKFIDDRAKQPGTLIEIGAGITVMTTRNVALEYLTNPDRRSVVGRINPRKERQSVRNYADLTAMPYDEISDDDVPDYVSQREDEALFTQANELVEIKMGGLDAITVLYDEIMTLIEDESL